MFRNFDDEPFKNSLYLGYFSKNRIDFRSYYVTRIITLHNYNVINSEVRVIKHSKRVIRILAEGGIKIYRRVVTR